MIYKPHEDAPGMEVPEDKCVVEYSTNRPIDGLREYFITCSRTGYMSRIGQLPDFCPACGKLAIHAPYISREEPAAPSAPAPTKPSWWQRLFQ